ncbi:chemotaxis protein CheW [Heliophilum fasciatum]|uniref:Chemotaxis protein CheW n=1 Tax=Heliophilum fasciatum TaxID=35700 RepID=A0A4V2SY67_9FIRM|nr:chemotaxis protein CheW [Heliophilum fasciatum]MCW2276693.1 purine-binding chemotaxis protein CheW [Heliophilum fasciatum]TCP68926.1 CheW protein [Heliophilum fasciatum]
MNEYQGDSGVIQLVVFGLGSEEYGVPITQVQEINRLTAPTKIPQAPSFVEGIINLRGKIIPVIDLKKRFQLPWADYSDSTRIIVINIAEHTVGIIVDAVTEVLRLPLQSVEHPPSMIGGISAEYLYGVGKIGERLLLLLEIDKILSKDEKSQLSF